MNLRKGKPIMFNREPINKLIRKAKKHEADAFTELMQMHMKDMYRTAIAILSNDDDAADAIQETILKCWERIDSLEKEAYFKTWMTRILINKCIDIKNSRIDSVGLAEYENYGRWDQDNLELKEALQTLEEKYRLPLMLFYGEGYKNKEIAEILNIPIGTVQTRISRGRNLLSEYYGVKKEK